MSTDVTVITRMERIVTATTDSRSVAVVRIAVAAAVLGKAGIAWPMLLALRDPAILRVPVIPWLPTLPGDAIPALLALWLTAGVAFLLGWRTRIAGAVLSLVLLCTLLADRQLYSNHLYLATTLTVLLTLADSGAAISLDARRDGRRARIRGWPVTLLKLQVSIVYGFAALSKLNLVYVSGAILNVYVGREALVALPEVARRWEVLAPLALVSILVEAFLALALWSERWRPLAVGVGVAFHATIVLTMAPTGELVVFSVLMLSLYLLHLDASPRPRVAPGDDSFVPAPRVPRG